MATDSVSLSTSSSPSYILFGYLFRTKQQQINSNSGQGWYSETAFGDLKEDKGEIVEQSLGLSFLKNYSDVENEIQETDKSKQETVSTAKESVPTSETKKDSRDKMETKDEEQGDDLDFHKLEEKESTESVKRKKRKRSSKSDQKESKKKKKSKDKKKKRQRSPERKKSKRHEKDGKVNNNASLSSSPEQNRNKVDVNVSVSTEQNIYKHRKLSASPEPSKDNIQNDAAPEQSTHETRKSSLSFEHNEDKSFILPKSGKRRKDKEIKTPERERKSSVKSSPGRERRSGSKYCGLDINPNRSQGRNRRLSSSTKDDKETSYRQSRKHEEKVKIKCVAETEFGTPDTDDYFSNWETDPNLTDGYLKPDNDSDVDSYVEYDEGSFEKSRKKSKKSLSPSHEKMTIHKKDVFFKRERDSVTPPTVSLLLDTKVMRTKSPSLFGVEKSPSSFTAKMSSPSFKRSPVVFKIEKAPSHGTKKSPLRLEVKKSELPHKIKSPSPVTMEMSPFSQSTKRSPSPIKLEKSPVSHRTKTPPSPVTLKELPLCQRIKSSPSRLSQKSTRSPSPPKLKNSPLSQIAEKSPDSRRKSPLSQRIKKSPSPIKMKNSLLSRRVKTSPSPLRREKSPLYQRIISRSPSPVKLEKSPLSQKVKRSPSPARLEKSTLSYKIKRSPPAAIETLISSFKIEKSPLDNKAAVLPPSPQLLEIPLNIKSIKYNISQCRDADDFDILPNSSTPRRDQGSMLFAQYDEDSWERDDFETHQISLKQKKDDKPEASNKGEKKAKDALLAEPKELENEYEKFMQAVSFETPSVKSKKSNTPKKKKRYSSSSSSSSSYDSDSSSDSSSSSSTSSNYYLSDSEDKMKKESLSQLTKNVDEFGIGPLPAPVPPPSTKAVDTELPVQKEKLKIGNIPTVKTSPVKQNSLVPTLFLTGSHVMPVLEPPKKKNETISSFVCISEGVKEEPKVIHEEPKVILETPEVIIEKPKVVQEEVSKPKEKPPEAKKALELTKTVEKEPLVAIEKKSVLLQMKKAEGEQIKRTEGEKRRKSSDSSVARRSSSRSPVAKPRGRSRRSSSPRRRRESHSPRRYRHRDYSPHSR